jgi:NDP-sugar pyrophosphorylase family protein
MTVIVLSGGLGTRLAGLWPDRPKALVPVAGRPFVERQLEGLAAHGLADVVLCAGHGAEALVEHVGDGARFGVRVRPVIEESPRGTAGALAHALRVTGHGAGTFFAVNGDTWAEFDPTAMLLVHRELGADATLACYAVDDASARGTVTLDDTGRLHAFREKAHDGPGWVSGGVYALEPRALADIDATSDGAPVGLEGELFPRLLAAGRTLGAWRSGGHFWDMGTPAGLARAEAALAAKEAP